MSVYTYEVKNVLATPLFKIHVHAAVKKRPGNINVFMSMVVKSVSFDR